MTPNQIRIILAINSARTSEVTYADLSKATGLGKAALAKELEAFKGTLERADYVKAMEFDDHGKDTWYFSLTGKGQLLAAQIINQRRLLSKRKK